MNRIFRKAIKETITESRWEWTNALVRVIAAVLGIKRQIRRKPVVEGSLI